MSTRKKSTKNASARGLVEQLMNEPDPREAWQRRQAEKMCEAVAEALEDGKREHEMTQRMKDVGTYDGPMLGDMLRPNRG